MPQSMVNVLLTSFHGLELPRTLCLPTLHTATINDVLEEITQRLPVQCSRLLVTTTSNRKVDPSTFPISSLLSTPEDAFVSLRLSLSLCGGKGGFGSQLRAAGGRMSSKRGKNQGSIDSSNRNLDGRRLRTVNEAKALAEYLALKPDMDRKEKEARRQRWERIVDMTERREYDIKNNSKGTIDAKWIEDKEDAGEKAREAVRVSMRSRCCQDQLGTAASITDLDAQQTFQGVEKTQPQCSTSTDTSTLQAEQTRCFEGFDENAEFMSASDSDGD